MFVTSTTKNFKGCLDLVVIEHINGFEEVLALLVLVAKDYKYYIFICWFSNYEAIIKTTKVEMRLSLLCVIKTQGSMLERMCQCFFFNDLI